MQLVVITPEQCFAHEAMVINGLFAEGLDTLHLRKPGSTELELRALLEKINVNFHDRVVLHDHFALCDFYRIKGIHLNRRNPEPPLSHGLFVSKSCHSLEELAGVEKDYHYVFLSPVFDSISKEGYRKAFTPDDLMHARDAGLIHSGVYALGGVSSREIPLAASYGFGGVAVLGALWQDFLQSRNERMLFKCFKELKKRCLID